MASNTFRKLLSVASAGLIFILYVHTPSFAQQTRSTPLAPIELSGITFEYAVLNSIGQLVWATPTSDKPNVIPSESQRLRFKATVNNRAPGTRIKLRAALQEVCPSPDASKRFLTKLRHLTETDPGDLTPDPADNEEQVVQPDGTVSIELPVHCDACTESACGRRCGAYRDHLGEGPHIVDLITTDSPPANRETSHQAARHSDLASALTSTLRVDLMSVCPAPQRQRGRRPAPRPRTTRRTDTAPRAHSSPRR
jgi:hypothetical protein